MLFLKKKYKDINEVKEEFLRIEEKHKIFNETFHEYHYWDFVRTYVFFQVVDRLNFYEKAAFTKALDITGIDPIELPHLNELNNPKSLVIWNNISARHIIDKEKFNKDTYYVILHKGKNIRRELYEINDKMFYWEFNLTEDDKIIKNVADMQKYKELEPLRKILLDIRKTFNIDKKEFIEINNRTFSSVFYNVNYSNKIKNEYFRFENLEKIYLTLPMYKYFSAAFKNTNVKTIEIQHGVMPSYDIKYSYPPHANAANTYNPDELWVNNKYWKEYCNNQYIYDVKVHKSPFVAREKEYVNEFNTKNILFISQWNLSEKITKLAIDFAKDNADYNVILRMHPAEEKDYALNQIGKYNLSNVSISQVEDIYDDLKHAEHVVGVISTVLFQSIEKGNKTYIYDLYNNKGFEAFYNNEMAYKVMNAKELSVAVKKSKFPNQEMINEFYHNDIENTEL